MKLKMKHAFQHFKQDYSLFFFGFIQIQNEKKKEKGTQIKRLGTPKYLSSQTTFNRVSDQN